MSNTPKSKHKIILPPADKAPLHTGNIITWMWYFLTPYKWTMYLFAVFRVVSETWLALLPIMIGYLIDGLETGKAQTDPSHFKWVLFFYMIGYFFFLYNRFFLYEAAATQKSIRGMTLYSINHLNKLSLNWHESQGSGGKLQRVMTGRKSYDELVRHIRWDFFPLLGAIVAVIVSVLITEIPSFYLALFLIFIVSYIWATWFFGRAYLRKYDVFNQKFEKLLSGVYEFVSSIRTAKAFNIGRYIDRKASGLEEEGQEAVINAFSTNLTRWTIANYVGTFWIFVFAWLGLYQVLDGTLSIGLYASTFFLACWIWASCETVGTIIEKVYEYGNGISRLVTTLRVVPKNLDLTPAQNFPDDWDNITLKDISYTYEGNADLGVKDISFTVKRGQKIALVGNSGAGKSTLVKLLMKQMLAHEGQFKIDNANISHIPTGEWLGNIGYVPQDVELFNLTIRENILIDRDDISEEFLTEILKQSALYEFIQTLPNGLETIIGERGVKLSGGQRQRLGIARALIRNAPIMIFDEATSSLDSISEAKIQTAIENSFDGRTVFVIAHRLSTVRNVDNIIVLDEGRIIEEGTFDRLIKKDGHFAHLWNIQTREE